MNEPMQVLEEMCRDVWSAISWFFGLEIRLNLVLEYQIWVQVYTQYVSLVHVQVPKTPCF